MMIAEIKNAAGLVLCHIKGTDEFVHKSLSTKLDRAHREGNIVTLKTIPAVKPEVKSIVDTAEESRRKDEELTRWFLDWPTNRR